MIACASDGASDPACMSSWSKRKQELDNWENRVRENPDYRYSAVPAPLALVPAGL
jgi:hypothetical protein